VLAASSAITENWSTLTFVATVTACSAATSPPEAVATTVSAPHLSLASYRSFSFGLSDPPKTGYAVTPRSLEVQRRLRSVVLRELQQRGYTSRDSQGELIVKLAAGTGPELLQDSLVESTEPAIPTGRVRGYIGINIYDSKTGIEIWEGSAFAEVDREKIDDSQLKMGVAHLLEPLPTRSVHSTVATN
jgi:hypothetical protein